MCQGRNPKLVYGRSAQRWDAAATLERLPPLYAVWHPYKQVVHGVYRRFLPLFVYVQQGTLHPDGQTQSALADLQTLEKWLGGFLLVPLEDRLRTCAF